MLIGADIAVVLVAAAAALLSYRNWERTRREAEGGPDQRLETGEGRTRFMKLWLTITVVNKTTRAKRILLGPVVGRISAPAAMLVTSNACPFMVTRHENFFGKP